jgi:threonine aldolase
MTIDTRKIDARRLSFASDYMEGAHPAILERLVQTNMEQTPGYGSDAHSERAADLIRVACAAPRAEVRFLAGGTQANACVIGCALRPWQGVVAASTGHVSTHEAGAIEFGGHKVLELPAVDGKISAAQVEAYAAQWEQDDNREHMVMPGMVYVSQPTEYGTLYSLDELEGLSRACHAHDMLLYVDGARLAYALATPGNDVTLPDLARLCDAFYVGGTKCGCLFGEAVVVPDPTTIPHFFTQIKQRGALLAKGRIAGIQFEVLFEDGLYERIGASAVQEATRIRERLAACGLEQPIASPTNQVFVLAEDAWLARFGERVEYSFWEKSDAGHTVIRLATSWATRHEDVDALLSLLDE